MIGNSQTIAVLMLAITAILPCSAQDSDEDVETTKDFLSQLRESPQYIGGVIGFGSALPTSGSDAESDGFAARVEYYAKPNHWLSPRAYAGFQLASSKKSTCVGCEVSAQIAFVGVKNRFMLPLPYAAPFVELGVGASAGSLVTRTLTTDKERNGPTVHIPASIGVALGEDHSFDFAFGTLWHPLEQQLCGVFGFGLSMRLR